MSELVFLSVVAGAQTAPVRGSHTVLFVNIERAGQRILGKERIPDRITIIYEGKVRLLGHDPRTQVPTTLKFLGSGEVLGEIGILRQFGCEIAIASSEVTCLTLDSDKYLQLLSRYPAFAEVRKGRCHFNTVRLSTKRY